MVDFDLGKQVGPLPLGGWVAVVGGGLTIAYFINRNQTGGSNDAQVPLTERGVGEGGGQILLPDDPAEGITENEPATNAQWSNRAINWLISNGTDGVTAANAVNKYLAADMLSVKEAALVNLVLAQFGAPPEGSVPIETEDPEPEADPEPDKPKKGKDPEIGVSGPSTVKRGGSTRIPGRAWWQDRSDPYGVRYVKVSVYRGSVLREISFIKTDDVGNFSFLLGKGNTNTKRGSTLKVVFQWEGARNTRWIKVV